MKKKWLSILLCLCMALTLLPVSALAADYPDGWPSDASLNEATPSPWTALPTPIKVTPLTAASA